MSRRRGSWRGHATVGAGLRSACRFVASRDGVIAIANFASLAGLLALLALALMLGTEGL